ncbi:glycosyltransferase family 25 protein [Solimonas flava]|uniref:glycosyltransferase family 25 protein n=1 Tax=Solimonas flava TaxID=415849 RepID=UPI000A051873|nr:glycosyltransferase family 25 protein [Solimonas flava]
MQAKIYIVSLKDACERRRLISQQLDQLPLAYEFVDAVDLRGVGKDAIDSSLIAKNLPLSGPEIGCALSHRAIYELMTRDNVPVAIVLEDDVTLLPGFGDLCRSALEIDATFGGVVILGGQEDAQGEYRQFFCRRRKFNLGRVQVRKAFMCDDRIKRTCCYMITLATARRLLQATTPISCAADEWQTLRKLNGHGGLWMTFPKVAAHPRFLEGQSTIESTRGRTQSKRVSSLVAIRQHAADAFRMLGGSLC